MKYFVLFVVLFEASLVQSTGIENISRKIDINLHDCIRSLVQSETILISMSNDQTQSILSNLNFPQNASRSDRSTSVYNALTQNSLLSQKATQNFLQNFGVSYESLWITNQIAIKSANGLLIQQLSLLPQVAKIEKDSKVFLIEDDDDDDDDDISEEEFGSNEYSMRQSQVEWDIEKIQAPKAWDLKGGNKGEGVILGIIDSGARPNHEAYKGSYVGKENYGWFDAVQGKADPYDDGGHGTYCLGKMVGIKGIGVAPGAKWMSCKGFAGKEGGTTNMLRCAQFMLCPTKPDGSSRDCSKAPHIINNSWGARGGNDLNGVIDAWRKAGQIPIFAAGNSGPDCTTILYPAYNPKVIAVGNTDRNDKISRSSSVGPSPDNYRVKKPDFCAPGSGIRSSSYDTDISYTSASGTSIAAPTVAGLVALMMSRDKEMSYEKIYSILKETSSRNVKSEGKECEKVKDNMWPNFHYGNGRIDALAAMQKVLSN